MNQRLFFILGALFMAIGIGLGAYGSHGLREQVSNYEIEVFMTGVNYQLFHGLGLLLIGTILYSHTSIFLIVSGYIMILGVTLFSGSLYTFVLFHMTPGLITPIGGSSLIIGWILLGINFLVTKERS